MAIQTRAYLKTRFETGDIPTEQDYIDLLDSYLSISGTGATEANIGELTDGSQTALHNHAPDANKLDKVLTTDQSVVSNVTFDKNASVKGLLIPFTNAPIFAVNNSNIQEMPVTAALSSINISGAAAGGNYRILLKNGVSGPYTYPSLGTSFGTATTNSDVLDGSSKVMNMIDVQVTVSTPIVVTHSIETVTLP